MFFFWGFFSGGHLEVQTEQKFRGHPWLEDAEISVCSSQWDMEMGFVFRDPRQGLVMRFSYEAPGHRQEYDFNVGIS